MLGRKLQQYEVLEKLGEGGMGVVYKARHTRLQRLVALKLLPPASTRDRVQRERFLREAQTASALNHPNIVTIYDIASEGDLDFIVMEYVEGRPLNRLIPRRGLPVRHALEFALQIADAVAAAHAAGIVHRDLKPANVFVDNGGRLRVLDFGLAKLFSPQALESEETLAPLTEAGLVFGTISYMAPEQAVGQVVDHRADIFSFGVMLYEMLTGVLPFRGANLAAVIHALHYDTPTPARELVRGVPAALEAVLNRALAKRPESRFRSMEELRVELKAIAARPEDASAAEDEASAVVPRTESSVAHTGEQSSVLQPPTAGSERASIAVLPFTSLSSDKEDEHLAAGLAAELISALSGVPDLRVASHIASFRYQGVIPPLNTVAAALGIRYVLTGSLRRAGSRIRVMAALTDAAPGVQLWAKTFERGVEDVFAVQEEIAQEIVGATGGQLIRARSEQASRSAPENLDAWGLVRRAYHFWNHAFTPDGVENALNLLRKAVDLDPGYAAARAYLGLYLIQRVVNFISPTPAADVAEALAAAEAAINLAPRDPEVLENSGLVYFNAGRYEDSVRALSRAVEIAPFNLVAWGYLALAHGWSGDEAHVREGLRTFDRLLKTAPDHPSVPYWLYFQSIARVSLANFQDALEPAERSTQLQPHFYIARLQYANVLGALGQTARAREEIARVLSVNPAVTSEAFQEAVRLLARSDERADRHLAGLRAAGWVARSTS